MIWDDPWVSAAVEPEGARLPPVPAVLPAGVEFRCWRDGGDGLDLSTWADFVRSGWGPSALAVRLRGAWVATVSEPTGATVSEPTGATVSERLRATCVLRWRGGDGWLLETLTARPRGAGWGRLLMRAAVRWLWEHTGGRFVLGFCWELNLRTALAAWWRGWMRAAVRLERGWLYVPEAPAGGCSFCDIIHRRHPWLRSAPARPVLLRGAGWSVVASDSGLGDGWCYVSRWEGPVDWKSVMWHGEWVALWARDWEAPPGSGWRWTGELVILAALRSALAVAPASLWDSPAEVAGDGSQR